MESVAGACARARECVCYNLLTALTRGKVKRMAVEAKLQNISKLRAGEETLATN